MNKVQTAQLRATISAFLSNNPGKHPTEAVAQHASVSNRTAGQVLLHMSKAGLINPMEKGKGTQKLWSWPEGGIPPAVQAFEQRRGPKQAVRPPKEVELVYNGILVVIGKNEQTGRLRITLEDA